MYGNMLLGVKPCIVRQFNRTYIYNQLAPAQTLPTSTCNQSQATFLACGLFTCAVVAIGFSVLASLKSCPFTSTESAGISSLLTSTVCCSSFGIVEVTRSAPPDIAPSLHVCIYGHWLIVYGRMRTEFSATVGISVSALHAFTPS